MILAKRAKQKREKSYVLFLRFIQLLVKLVYEKNDNMMGIWTFELLIKNSLMIKNEDSTQLPVLLLLLSSNKNKIKFLRFFKKHRLKVVIYCVVKVFGSTALQCNIFFLFIAPSLFHMVWLVKNKKKCISIF